MIPKISTLLLGSLFFFFQCQAPESTSNDIEDAKVKITIMYPNSEGKTFDMEYYKNQHMPMLADLFGDAMKGYKIDEGLSGRTPSDTIPFLAIGYLLFNSIEEYNAAFGPNAQQILGDIPNYTNIQPIVQISKVVK